MVMSTLYRPLRFFKPFKDLVKKVGKRDGLNHRHVVCRMPVLPGIQESVLDRRGGAIAADLSGTTKDAQMPEHVAVAPRNCKGSTDA